MQQHFQLGCQMSVPEWIEFNRSEIFENAELAKYAAPFPPFELMRNTTGLQTQVDFASHGADIYKALSDASLIPLSNFKHILDFGCGCGRLARMFKGHAGRLSGCDIDSRHVEWMQENIKYMDVKLSSVVPPIPFKDNEVDCEISISIFTHLTEKSQDQFLAELHRVADPDGYLFITVHGQRALDRAISEPTIRAMLDMEESRFQHAQKNFSQNQHAFVLQHGHLTNVLQENISPLEVIKQFAKSIFKRKAITESFEYGITFVPEAYLRNHWGKWFDVVDYRYGGIHDFQDIVVLKPKK